MENTNEVTSVNQVADGVSIEFDTTKGTTEVNAENSVTMSKADFNKAIQSAEDKLLEGDQRVERQNPGTYTCTEISG